MADQSKDGRSLIIGGAVGITVGFLVLFGWLLSRTDKCPNGWEVWERLACLEPNALGDTFAGAFAPVAFVWLVAAVMLQRNELKAQRQELRESREVAEAQVVEARNNVAFMEQQTHLLQAREEFERKEKTDDEFRDYVEALSDFIESSFNIIRVATYQDDGMGNEGDYSVVPLLPSNNDDYFKRIQAYSASISECSIAAHQAAERGETVRYFGREELRSIRDHLQVLQQKADLVSDALQIRFQIIKADAAIWRIESLLTLLEEKGERIPEFEY